VAPQTLAIVMTAHGSVESTVEALRAGAADYILKPVVFDDVLAKVARVLEHRQLAWQTQMLRREVERHVDFERLIGDSATMQEVFHLIRKVAPTQTTVLISGESGTGKGRSWPAPSTTTATCRVRSSSPSTAPHGLRKGTEASAVTSCAANPATASVATGTEAVFTSGRLPMTICETSPRPKDAGRAPHDTSVCGLPTGCK
jgi:hypothetical protein